MPEFYHVLNGDALKFQFPKELKGEEIVARECFVDGPASASSSQTLWEVRADFMSNNYGTSTAEYAEKSILELEKIKKIDTGAEVNLWFEEDLFCQVNMWFVAAELQASKHKFDVYWVKPEPNNWLGFGGAKPNELISFYEQRVAMNEQTLARLASLWLAYQHHDFNKLRLEGEALSDIFKQLPGVIEAHIDRFPAHGLGRPQKRLIEIMKALHTRNFGSVFKVFCETEGIYGFGDLQVQRLFDEVINLPDRP